MMNNIEALRQKSVAADKAARAAQDEYHVALCKTHKFQVGDIILSTTEERAQVTAVFIKYGETLHIACAFKKDGTLGSKQIPTWRDEWRKATLENEQRVGA